jgi:hypothetical protein
MHLIRRSGRRNIQKLWIEMRKAAWKLYNDGIAAPAGVAQLPVSTRRIN